MKIFKTDDFKTINKYTLSFNSFKINKLYDYGRYIKPLR